jgi:hypothetical protein
MTRHDHSAFAGEYLSPSWAVRWEQARGTYSEKAVLMSIAAEALNHDDAVWAAAYDAATTDDPVERQRFIEDLEDLFDDANDPHDATYALDVDFLRDEACEWRAGL